MKKTVFIIMIFLVAVCIDGFSQGKNERDKVKADTVAADSLEYELIIMDPGFETWLATKPSKEFFTKEYLEIKNRLYVSEWNYRYTTSLSSGLYETYIDYNHSTDYGLDLNYKLYNYFRYFEKKNGVKLIKGSR